MADQVQVKLVGDDKAFLKTLQTLRDRFKQLQSASNKAQKTVRTGATKSKTQLNLQRNAVRLLSGAYVRLGRVAVASQKIMQTQIRRTSSLLRKQIALLRRAGVAPRGGAIGAAGARQPRQVRTPANDRPQFFGTPAAQTRPAPTGTPVRNVNAQGNLTQAALAKEQAAIQRVDAQRERSAQRAVAGEQRKAASTQKSTGAIRKQSQPLTLLVAKFALMAFAVQTLANIVNSTFGAMLRVIDEFQVAAIGVATAVTGIAAAGQGSIGEVFNQNLEAALATFEALELVAARFFSTGQELQLAFNTLAQRGVIVRQDEFEILGKITDQIKLLTGGQNTQIQIQQELRAILDGNVRTTTAFGKALQARGVDIGQLSREVRATGSLKPFEPFLTGLDAAGPAIRRTLSSVTATFTSLFNILQRNIFQSTFDGIVTRITNINNFIIEMRTELIQVGQVIVSKIAAGFDLVKRALAPLVDLIADLGSNNLAGILIFFKALSLVASGPLRAILVIGAIIFQLTGDFEALGKASQIFFKALRVGFKIIDDGLAGLTSFDNLLKNTLLTFKGFKNVSLVIQEEGLESKLTGLTPEERATPNNQLIQARLDLVRAQIIANNGEISAIVNESGEESGEAFVEGLADGINTGLDFLNDELDKKINELGIPESSERIKKAFQELLKEAKALGTTGGEFTVPQGQFQLDIASVKRNFKAVTQEEEKIDKDRTTRAAQIFSIRRAQISLLNQQEKLTGTELFKQRAELQQKEALFQQQELARQIAQAKERGVIERNILVLQGKLEASDPQFLSDAQVTKQLSDSALRTTKQVADLNRQITDSKVEGSNIERQNTERVLQAQRELSRLLASRREGLEAAFGGETNVDRAARTQRQSENATGDFIREQPDASNAQVIEFAQQQRTMQVQENIRTQLEAVTSAIDAAFQTLIDGIVEGSFEFRDLAKTLSKDFIKAGLQDLIAQTKEAITDGLTSLFEGFSDVAAQRAAQALALGIGLLLAVLSRSGNSGDFTATGGAGGGVNQSSVQTRGLLGGDQNIAIAEINNGLQEALIPTNAILSQIELNTRPLVDLNLGIDPNALAQAITAQVQGLFSQALLQTP